MARRGLNLIFLPKSTGTANESTDTTQAFASSTASLENLQTTDWDTSTAGIKRGTN